MSRGVPQEEYLDSLSHLLDYRKGGDGDLGGQAAVCPKGLNGMYSQSGL